MHPDPILQRSLPYSPVSKALPGIAPCDPAQWILFDEVEEAQIAEKARVLVREGVKALDWVPGSEPAQQEALDCILKHLHTDHGRRPKVSGPPLWALSQIVQDDIVIMEQRGDEHVLTAAVLGFPASWRLQDKIDRPLSLIHDPVPEYTDIIAKRVQRLFHGIQVGRPLWRYNALWYEDPTLYQPRSATTLRPLSRAAPYFRSERQVLMRLPKTGAVVFSIHTFVLARADVPEAVVDLTGRS